MSTSPAPALLRRLLLAILLLGIGGTAAELLLAGHTEDASQWIPLALLAISLLVLSWHAMSRGAASLRSLQVTMALFVISGVAGIVLHCQGKMEFKKEVDPSLSGWPLFWQALQSQSPPALAPGIMIQMGLLGLAYTVRHPALEKNRLGPGDAPDARQAR